MTAAKTENPLGYEKIGKLLASFAIPSVISLIINSLYNMVDQIFIGQGVGFLGNGATNIIAPISIITIALSSLFGDGLAAFFSLQLGKGKQDTAATGVGNAILVSGVISIIWCIVASIFLGTLCNIFGATENLMPYALGYGHIIVLGFPFVIIGTVINASVRTDGSPKYAMFAMMIGAILNMILDPIFIFAFKWGVQGAALATIISQLFGMICNIFYLFKFKNIKLNKDSFILDPHVIKKICALGFASCFNNLTTTVVSFVSNNLLTKYGALSKYGEDIPITTFGLCMKVSMLALSIAIGIASGSQPIIGFNYGAKKYKRVKLMMLADVQLCATVFFQAIGQSVKATVVSLSKQLLFYVPAMLILSKYIGLVGILWAGPVADIAAFTLAVVLCIKELKKMEY